MNANKFAVGLCGLALWTSAPAYSQQTTVAPNDDPKWLLVGRLDLERYKATLRGLGQYGDRQQGTDRNRAAVDWIEAQLRSYGCAPERIKYVYNSPGLSRDQQIVAHPPGTPVGSGEIVMGLGGARMRGMTLPVVPNNNPAAQTDPVLRALNEGPSTPGPREEVYCTKVGSTRPDEMYIVGAHMDGRGFGEATDDDGSGTALVMELARVFSGPDVRDRALDPLRALEQRGNRPPGRQRLYSATQPAAGQGGSARIGPLSGAPVARHDPARHAAMGPWHATGRWDHRPRAAPGGRHQYRVPGGHAKFAAESMGLAFLFRDANERYATDYPAAVGNHMTNTDSSVFMNLVPSISLRENERGMQIGAGWNPHYHQATDRYTSYSDKDFRLGLNAAQTTLGAIAQLTGATLRK